MICLDTNVDDDIYYYTRIRRDAEYYAIENLNFAQTFHGRTFDKNAGDDIVKYLESNKEGDNSSFQKVDIHSSYDLVTWGDLEILDKKDLDIRLCEINEQTAIITMDYQVVLKNSADETEYYNAPDNIQIRHNTLSHQPNFSGQPDNPSL